METACAAVIASVEAGDVIWFDRLVVQLRSVLVECQQSSAHHAVVVPEATAPAEARVTVGGGLGPFPLATQRSSEKDRTVQPCDPVTGPPSTAELVGPAWLQALRLLEAAAGLVPERTMGHPTPSSPSP